MRAARAWTLEGLAHDLHAWRGALLRGGGARRNYPQGASWQAWRDAASEWEALRDLLSADSSSPSLGGGGVKYDLIMEYADLMGSGGRNKTINVMKAMRYCLDHPDEVLSPPHLGMEEAREAVRESERRLRAASSQDHPRDVADGSARRASHEDLRAELTRQRAHLRDIEERVRQAKQHLLEARKRSGAAPVDCAGRGWWRSSRAHVLERKASGAGWRSCGDGNCFYRSVSIGLLEQAPARWLHLLQGQLSSPYPRDSQGLTTLFPPPTRAELAQLDRETWRLNQRELVERVGHIMKHVKPYSPEMTTAMASVQQLLNARPELDLAMVRAMRLFAADHLDHDAAIYQNYGEGFVAGKSDSPQLERAVSTRAEYRRYVTLQLWEDADSPDIDALARALDIQIVLANVAQQPPFHPTGSPTVHLVRQGDHYDVRTVVNVEDVAAETGATPHEAIDLTQ